MYNNEIAASTFSLDGAKRLPSLSFFTPSGWPWSAESSISLTRGHNSDRLTYIYFTAALLPITNISQIFSLLISLPQIKPSDLAPGPGSRAENHFPASLK